MIFSHPAQWIVYVNIMESAIPIITMLNAVQKRVASIVIQLDIEIGEIDIIFLENVIMNDFQVTRKHITMFGHGR